MTRDTWNPAQYAKFQHERELPFFDLLALIRPAPAMRVVDLGCGTGRLTRLLHSELRARETIGVDRSPRMLDVATRGELPDGVRFEIGDINAFGRCDEYDLIFSNAAFQWVEDHDALLGRLATALKPAGQLAFQVPANHADASHTIAEELAADERFRSAFGGWHRPQPVLPPETYARLLYRLGFSEPHVRLVVYAHLLPGPEDVVEWMKGTLLTDYERRLPADRFAAFLDTYRRRLLAQIGSERPHFFPFTRILCWGRKSA